MTWVLDGRPLRRVLVTRLRYLGDVVMSTVVLEALRLGDPDLRLGFLCEEAAAPVLQGHPLLDRLHVLGTGRSGADARARAAHGTDLGQGSGWLGCVRGLRAADYDLAVDLFFNPRSALLLRGAGIPLRIGGARSWRRRLYTHTVTDRREVMGEGLWRAVAPGGLGDHLCRLGPLRHAESGLGFADWLATRSGDGPLLPRLAVPPAGSADGRALTAAGVEPQEAFLVLAPGATWPAKMWPAARWRELARLLLAHRAEKLVVLTPPGGAGTGWSADLPPGRGGVLPALPLREVMALLGRARAVVAVDGGVMHAAVGLGAPTVALFGPTEPEIWFPYADDPRFEVLGVRPPCHPCHLHECASFTCLPAIRPAQVLEALDRVLGPHEQKEPPGPGNDSGSGL